MVRWKTQLLFVRLLPTLHLRERPLLRQCGPAVAGGCAGAAAAVVRIGSEALDMAPAAAAGGGSDGSPGRLAGGA